MTKKLFPHHFSDFLVKNGIESSFLNIEITDLTTGKKTIFEHTAICYSEIKDKLAEGNVEITGYTSRSNEFITLDKSYEIAKFIRNQMAKINKILNDRKDSSNDNSKILIALRKKLERLDLPKENFKIGEVEYILFKQKIRTAVGLVSGSVAVDEVQQKEILAGIDSLFSDLDFTYKTLDEPQYHKQKQSNPKKTVSFSELPYIREFRKDDIISPIPGIQSTSQISVLETLNIFASSYEAVTVFKSDDNHFYISTKDYNTAKQIALDLDKYFKIRSRNGSLKSINLDGNNSSIVLTLENIEQITPDRLNAFLEKEDNKKVTLKNKKRKLDSDLLEKLCGLYDNLIITKRSDGLTNIYSKDKKVLEKFASDIAEHLGIRRRGGELKEISPDNNQYFLVLIQENLDKITEEGILKLSEKLAKETEDLGDSRISSENNYEHSAESSSAKRHKLQNPESLETLRKIFPAISEILVTSRNDFSIKFELKDKAHANLLSKLLMECCGITNSAGKSKDIFEYQSSLAIILKPQNIVKLDAANLKKIEQAIGSTQTNIEKFR